MLLVVNVRTSGVWDDAIVKNPSEGQRSEQETSLIIANLTPKFQEINSLNLGLHGIQQDSSMGPIELVKDSLFRLAGAELHVRVGPPKIFEIFFLLYRNF